MNQTPELQLVQYDPVEDAELFFNIDDGLNANWTKVDDAIKDMRMRLRAPVADLAALKAIDTTNIVDRALCFCAALGMYRFDKTSAAAGNDDTIVTPTTGGGRWLLMIGSDGKSLDARKLNGQAPSYYAKDSDVQALLASLDGGVTNTPTIGIGMNRINHTGEVAVFPEIDFTGQDIINRLGKIGDCDNINNFQSWNTSNTKDTSIFMFGTSSIKLTMVDTTGNSALVINDFIPDKTKYYLLSGYIKVGNLNLGAVLSFEIQGKGSWSSSTTTDSTKFVRKCVKISPTMLALQSAETMFLGIAVGGAAAGQYCNFDGLMLNEITAEDYNLTDDQIMEKYPYGESYFCLTNPSFENRRHNLVRNGNCEEGTARWTNQYAVSTISVEDGKFKIIFASGDAWYQIIPVEKNKDYYLICNFSGTSVTVDVRGPDLSTWLRSGSGTFNSGSNNAIVIRMTCPGAGTGYFDSIMLIEGTVAPAEYKSCDHQVWVAEGQFASGDTFKEKDGSITGLRWKRHKTLFGKDITPIYVGDYAGFKVIQLSDARTPAGPQISTDCLVKYDGKIMVYEGGSSWAPDKFAYDGANANLYLSAADTDSGWAEAVLPNNDEAKVFLNGWKAIWNNGTRYIGWASVLDNSVPSSAIVSTASGVNAAGQNKLNVTDGTKFANGNFVYLKHDDGNVYGYGVSSVAGNQLTLGSNLSASASNNNSIALTDNYGTVAQNLLNWCKANVAPGYEGYRLHYKLLNSEPITDENVHVHGDIWSIVPGDNYITVDSGIVIGEVANPIVYNDGNAYINNTLEALKGSILQRPAEDILSIKRNDAEETEKWTVWRNITNNVFGKSRADIAQGYYDANATYTVDYQILKILHAQAFGSLTLKYAQDVFTAITGTAKATEAKQERNSVLDTLVTTATYEECSASPNRYLSWCISGSTLFIEFSFDFKVAKEEVPAVSYSGLNLWVLDVNVLPLFTVHGFYITKKGVSVRFKTTDSATIASIKTNGIAGALAIKVTKKGA